MELVYGELSNRVLAAAVEVHKVLGPGFLESVYEQALSHELRLRHVAFKTQVPLPVRYKDFAMGNTGPISLWKIGLFWNSKPRKTSSRPTPLRRPIISPPRDCASPW